MSGTAGSGATVRMYLEKYQPDKTMLGLHPLEALGELVEVALKLSNLQEFTGRKEPTVITYARKGGKEGGIEGGKGRRRRGGEALIFGFSCTAAKERARERIMTGREVGGKETQ